jgi:hypothetical protein
MVPTFVYKISGASPGIRADPSLQYDLKVSARVRGDMGVAGTQGRSGSHGGSRISDMVSQRVRKIWVSQGGRTDLSLTGRQGRSGFYRESGQIWSHSKAHLILSPTFPGLWQSSRFLQEAALNFGLPNPEGSFLTHEQGLWNLSLYTI